MACIALLVHKHSAVGKVLTPGNACQLVRLLLSKAIYPNEVITACTVTMMYNVEKK